MSYTFSDIKKAYQKAGVTKGSVILAKTDLRFLGAYEEASRTAVLDAHLNALSDLIDFGVGTLIVSTASDSLCNTDKPFDIAKTRSERGVFTDHVRKQKGSVRSRHPFLSYTAIGAHADIICNNVSRHSYGLETPKARMLELDARYLSIGQIPQLTCSYVHHLEMLMGVPYRYTKEFAHPIVQRDGSIEKEMFYMYVWYRGITLDRNRNKKIFDHFNKSGYSIDVSNLGDGKAYGYSCNQFCKSTAKYLSNDIYGWLNSPPDDRPYTL